MSSDLSRFHLEILREARDAVVSALQSKCCEWEQESADAIDSGNLSLALMTKEWAFAADLLSTVASNEFFSLTGRIADVPANSLRSNVT